MTSLERKEAELEKLYQYRQAAMKSNNIMWLSKNQDKIDALEKEIIEIRKFRPTSMKKLLENKSEECKNRFYKGMLRISLLSDAVNEACEQMKTMFKDELGVDDFSMRREVEEMRKLSQQIASFAIIPNNEILEDFMVDNGKFVDRCIVLADLHLKEKLNL